MARAPSSGHASADGWMINRRVSSNSSLNFLWIIQNVLVVQCKRWAEIGTSIAIRFQLWSRALRNKTKYIFILDTNLSPLFNFKMPYEIQANSEMLMSCWWFTNCEHWTGKIIGHVYLVSSGVISVGCKSTGAWDDVWVASTELSGAQRWINILRCWNDRLSVVAGESVIAIVLQSAPSTGDAFLGLRSPNFSCVQAEALMRSRRGPCTGARSTRTLTEARFSWWIHQVTRLAWAVSIAIVIARCCATIVARWAFGISVLAQSAAWFDSAWAAAIAARVTRWYI